MKSSFDHIPTSQLLQETLATAPEGRMTLVWLLDGLRDRSFGMIMIFLGLIAMVPGICVLAGAVLAILGFQMIMARDAPVLPKFVGLRPLPPRVAQLLGRSISIIIVLERFIRPRWYTPFVTTKRFVGLIVTMLAVTLFIPIPLSNVVPGALTMLIAFAYLEEDGFLLCIALSAGVAALAITGLASWASIEGAALLFHM
ncbi:MAG TPA: exopolysaccharide biosynthesis protein [Rhizomicrobium sp.]